MSGAGSKDYTGRASDQPEFTLNEDGSIKAKRENRPQSEELANAKNKTKH